jgi:hypothetical protein
MDKRSIRFFNTTGPCRPEMHYMLPPAEGTAVACYLLIFDRRPEKGTWEERLFWTGDGDLTVLGC